MKIRLENKAFQAFFEPAGVEVDQKALLYFSQFHIGQQLCLVDAF